MIYRTRNKDDLHLIWETDLICDVRVSQVTTRDENRTQGEGGTY
jgi:hypothetical protein